MSPPRILDTHIHLWPGTAVSPADHGWMTPGHALAKRHGIADYAATTSSTSPIQPAGFIYVETDRFLPAPRPQASQSAAGPDGPQTLNIWANEPLEELKFLRRIVDERPNEGDGFAAGQGAAMLGCVVWAPFLLAPSLFDAYLSIAEEVSGPRLWERVVGFRYLLQGRGEDDVRQLVQSGDWIRNLAALRKGRGGRGWTFDVGVDAHRDGVEVVEVVADMVERVRAVERESPELGSVRFVLNHLCKPYVTPPETPWPSFPRYKAALLRLAADRNTYIKLSGAFNEFGPGPTPPSVDQILESLGPYLQIIREHFGSRILFGSDWPVCNVGGPRGEQSWGLWREVVEAWVRKENVGEEVWAGAGCEVYGVEIKELGGE